jgi:hypothetical protein
MISAILQPFVHEVGSLLARAEKEIQQSAALALGTDFATADEIAFRDDADQFPAGIDYRKPASEHQLCGFGDRRIAGTVTSLGVMI